MATIEAYLDNNGNVTPTAETLFTHRHTVRYRLERVRELCGHDLSSTEGREKIGLGLKAMRVLGIHAPGGPALEPGTKGGRAGKSALGGGFRAGAAAVADGEFRGEDLNPRCQDQNLECYRLHHPGTGISESRPQDGAVSPLLTTYTEDKSGFTLAGWARRLTVRAAANTITP